MEPSRVSKISQFWGPFICQIYKPWTNDCVLLNQRIYQKKKFFFCLCKLNCSIFKISIIFQIFSCNSNLHILPSLSPFWGFIIVILINKTFIILFTSRYNFWNPRKNLNLSFFLFIFFTIIFTNSQSPWHKPHLLTQELKINYRIYQKQKQQQQN